MQLGSRLVLALILMVPALAVAAVPALVDSDWVKSNLGRSDLVVLDIQAPADYQRFHVPGAVNAPYERWRTSGKREVEGMLPPVARLEAMIGGLGIDDRKTVVVVSTGRGAGDLAAAARVFWTFKVLGHDQVAVLDGGLVAYAQAKPRGSRGRHRYSLADWDLAPDVQRERFAFYRERFDVPEET